MWGRRVAGVSHVADDLAEPHLLTLPHRDGPGCQVREGSEQLAPSHDDVVAEHRCQPCRREDERVLQHEDKLEQRMDTASLPDPVDGADDLTIERCVDPRAPAVALLGRDAQEQQARPAGGMPMQPSAVIDTEEVEGEALAQHVGAMARDAVRGRVDRDPSVPAERGRDHHGACRLADHVPIVCDEPGRHPDGIAGQADGALAGARDRSACLLRRAQGLSQRRALSPTLLRGTPTRTALGKRSILAG